MISGILGVLYAFLFVLILSIGIYLISSWDGIKNKPEVTLMLKALVLAFSSVGILLMNRTYFLLDAVAKAGLTVAILLVLVLPVLWILKRNKQKFYERLISIINRYI